MKTKQQILKFWKRTKAAEEYGMHQPFILGKLHAYEKVLEMSESQIWKELKK